MSYDQYLSDSIVRFELMARCEEKGLRAFCRNKNLDPGHVSKIINSKKPISENVAKSVGYEQVIMYKKVK